jgi:1-pyrroline-5-carboxylate dehydrogenase
VWTRLRDEFVEEVRSLPMGDPADLSNFTGAVIDRRAYDKLDGALQRIGADPAIEVLAGGSCDDSVGFFVEPTVAVGSDPCHDMFRTEYFGPLLAVHVYDDRVHGAFDRALELVDSGASYALTGSVIGTDRAAIARASQALRFTAGNFYVNDRPTGAVVGQEPFGGARASGTNDKAGSILNLLRWTSPRSIKENLSPPTTSAYPHQGAAQ